MAVGVALTESAARDGVIDCESGRAGQRPDAAVLTPCRGWPGPTCLTVSKRCVMLEKDRQRPNSASACEHINKALAYANHNWSWDERETLADMLLLGWIDSSGNHRYFKKGSREERTARSAVAYLLRHPERLGWWTSHRVADVFDPSSLYARDISFGFRGEGKPGTRIRHRQIARDMLRT